MYQLVLNVQVGGTTVDDDVQSFGIRESNSTPEDPQWQEPEISGVCLHQDYHGLGMALRSERYSVESLSSRRLGECLAHSPRPAQQDFSI